MRTIVTGASGFVGSNIAKVLEERHGDTVIGDRVDMTDRAAVRAHVEMSQTDAIVHCAILNDWARMHADRELAWAAYVESTRSYADIAAERDIPFCLVSTDWVFDGTQRGATESTPPNPINLYGFLKAASEIVALDRGGTVCHVDAIADHGVAVALLQDFGDVRSDEAGRAGDDGPHRLVGDSNSRFWSSKYWIAAGTSYCCSSNVSGSHSLRTAPNRSPP